MVNFQKIFLEVHCNKGVGYEHAKWSPVSMGWHPYITEIVICRLLFDLVLSLIFKLLPGLINSEKCLKYTRVVTRNSIENEKMIEKVRYLSNTIKFGKFLKLRKKTKFTILKIESSGVLESLEIFKRATLILTAKIIAILNMFT